MGRESGYDLFLHSNAPPGSGLGSSSAVMVALIGLLKEFHGQPLTDYEVADLAFELERNDLGIQGGLQDQYAATFGGFNLIEFKGDRVIVNPLRISADVMHELEHNMLLCYTGGPAHSDQIIDDQTGSATGRNGRHSWAEGAEGQLAVEMKNALLQRRLTEFGDLLDAAWEAKKRMSARDLQPPHRRPLRRRARRGRDRRQGHRGRRRGIHALVLSVSEEASRRQRVARVGGEVTEFAFTSNGLTTWSVHE